MLSKKGKTFDLDLDSETDSESSANEYGCSDPGQEECKETEVGERKSCPRPGGSLQSLLNDAQNKSKKCDEEPGQNSDDSFDWEDGDNVDEDEEKEHMEQDSTGTVGATGDIHIDLNNIGEQVLATGDLFKSGKHRKSSKKKKVKRFTKEEKLRFLQLHQSHLLLLAVRTSLLNKWCSDNLLRASALSVLPQKVIRQVHQQGYIPRSGLDYFAQWFNRSFDLKERITDEEGRSGSNTTALLKALACKQGTAAELVQLFVAMCRAAGLGARLVAGLRPTSAAAAAAAAAARKGVVDLTEDIREEPAGKKIIRKRLFPVWAEVLTKIPYQKSDGGGTKAHPRNKTNIKWTHINPVLKLVDEPLSEDLGQSLYIFAIDGNGEARDVTRRYTEKWSKLLKSRAADRSQDGRKTWWYRVCKAFSGNPGPSVAASGKTALNAINIDEIAPKNTEVLNANQNENEELETNAANEAMPTSLNEFRTHQIYCIDKYIKKYEVIYPRKPVAMFKGHVVFKRDNIHEVKSEMQWRRVALQVKASEQNKPVKKVDSQKTKGLELFGHWQTQPIEVLDVIDAIDLLWESHGSLEFQLFSEEDTKYKYWIHGQVPKTEHGNVELWDYNLKLLPNGAIYKREPKIAVVAKKLGIDYAPALVGFQSGRNGSTPVIDGIIVAAKHQDLLNESYQNWNQAQIEKQVAKRNKETIKRWSILVTGLLIKHRLANEYGTK